MPIGEWIHAAKTSLNAAGEVGARDKHIVGGLITAVGNAGPDSDMESAAFAVAGRDLRMIAVANQFAGVEINFATESDVGGKALFDDSE